MLDDIGKIFRFVIDAALGSQCFAGATLIIAAGSGEDPVPERAGDLERGHADAGSAALHQQGFSFGQASPVEHVAPDGKECFWQGGCLQWTQALRYWQALCCRRHAILGIAAALDQRTYHVPKLKGTAAHIAANNFARHFEARQVGSAGWNWVVAGSLQYIRPVHAGGMDFNQYFAGFRSRNRTFTDLQHIRRAVLRDFNGIHAGSFV